MSVCSYIASVGAVDAQAVRHARAAIVRAQLEALEAQRAHHVHLVLRHRALAVFHVRGAAGRLGRRAIAAQVRGDDGVVAHQLARHLVPDHVALRMPMQQQQRRAAAADHAGDLDPIDRLAEGPEAGEQRAIRRSGGSVDGQRCSHAGLLSGMVKCEAGLAC
jgi:hypothetical protein